MLYPHRAMSPRPHSNTRLATLVTVVALSLGCERAAPVASLDAALIDPRDAVDAAKTEDLAVAPDALDASVTGDEPAPSDVALDVRSDVSLDAAMTDAAAGRRTRAPCAEADRFAPLFGAQMARWTAQDALAPWAPGAVVFVGSSSIRRWEGLARAYADYAPIQRGLGGAQLGEIARAARDARRALRAPRGGGVRGDQRPRARRRARHRARPPPLPPAPHRRGPRLGHSRARRGRGAEPLTLGDMVDRERLQRGGGSPRGRRSWPRLRRRGGALSRDGIAPRRVALRLRRPSPHRARLRPLERADSRGAGGRRAPAARGDARRPSRCRAARASSSTSARATPKTAR